MSDQAQRLFVADSALSPGPGNRNLILLFLVLLVVGLGLVCATFAKYHADEHYYTDSALGMIEKGDYWTPYFSDGRIRLRKPIGTYWAIAGSFRAFGVSVFSSRLPSLIAGFLTILATGFLARKIFPRQPGALLALLVLAANTEVLALSCRATPDALVCLFMLIGACGVVQTWFGERPGWGPWVAWTGLGLAVQTKGLLGLCPLLHLALFILVDRTPGWLKRLRKLFDWRALLIGVTLGGFWYVAMLRIHGLQALGDFFNDQVGAKVDLGPGSVLTNFAAYTFGVLRHFGLWLVFLIPLLVWRRAQLGAFWRQHRSECLFLVLFCPLLVVIFSFGNAQNSRYVSASYPTMAVLVAALLQQGFASERLERSFRRGVYWAGSVFAVGGIGAAIYALRLDARLVFAGLLIFLAGLAGVMASRWWSQERGWLWVSAALIVPFVAFLALVRPVTSPSPFVPVARRLCEVNPPQGIVHTLSVKDVPLAQIRLAAHGKLHFQELEAAPDATAPESPKVILATDQSITEIPQPPYRATLLSAEQTHGKSTREKPQKKPRKPGGREVEYWVALKQP